jgi:hypothetical protein
VRLIDEKILQIEATINHIRADPGRLTGDTRRRRRFVPVLVIAEGVPVNPLTHMAIADRLAAAGRLTAADVGPLHILDTEELYVAEAMAENERLGLNELLARHGKAGLMRRVDLKSWLLMDGWKSARKRPERLNPVLDSATDRVLANLGLDQEALEVARQERWAKPQQSARA